MTGSDARPLRVVLADDSVLFRSGLAHLLGDEGFEVVGEAGDAAGALALVERERPDVAVLDIRMPPDHQTEGLEAAIAIRDRHPSTAVLLLSAHVETRHAIRLLRANAAGVGYLLKDRVMREADLLDAIRRVASGGSVIDPEVVGAAEACVNPSDCEARVVAGTIPNPVGTTAAGKHRSPSTGWTSCAAGGLETVGQHRQRYRIRR